MLGRRRGNEERDGWVAVELSPCGFSLVRVSVAAGARPRLQCCEVQQLESPEDRVAALTECVRQQGLVGARTALVLTPEGYSLRALDAPDVPPDELRSAIRWCLHDLVDFEIQDALVDFYTLPQQDRRHTRALYAVAAPREPLREQVETLVAAGLDPLVIEAPELALRNLVAHHPLAPNGLAVLALRRDAGLITVTREQSLYIARWIDASLERLAALDLKEALPADPDATQPELDDLMLQIQRSIDYYQHELVQHPVSRLLLTSVEGEVPGLDRVLARQLGVATEWLRLDELIECPPGLTSATVLAALPAIGAALRPDTPGAPLQSVNLYERSLRRRHPPLAPQRMAQLLIAFIAMLGLLSLGLWIRERADHSSLQELALRAEQQAEKLSQLEAALESHLDRGALDARISALEGELRAKQKLEQLFATRSLGNASGFSRQLRGLSRQHISGLWLREFELRRGGEALTLRGSALQAEAVPRLLQRLGREEAFQGLEFHRFALSRRVDDTGAIDFEVSTDVEDGA
ncbi:MAG: hypothetical protein ACE5FG_11710 [Myxococcota bacterium]